MYCDACGVPLEADQKFCPGCGKSCGKSSGKEASAGPAAARPARRVASHIRMLMALWMALAVLRLLSMVPELLLWLPTGMPQVGMALGPGSLLHLESPLSRAGWAFLLVTSAWTVACLVVAWGLLDRARWARTYTIVVSAIWLLDFPLGTALSIYTLWVLLPESSEAEYRQLAMP